MVDQVSLLLYGFKPVYACCMFLTLTCVATTESVAACQVARLSPVCYIVDCHVHYCLSQNRIYNSHGQCVDAGWRTHERDYQLINERRVVIIVRYIKYASTLNFDV